MKQPLLLLVILAAMVAVGFGAATARELILKTKLALEHGQQDVRVQRSGTTVVYRVSTTGRGFACQAVRGASPVNLKLSRPRAMPSDLGCSCGTKCWEDREAKMSICVCRICNSNEGWIVVESTPAP